MNIIKNKIKKEIHHAPRIMWSYGVSLSDIRKDLDELEKYGVTGINIGSTEDHYVYYQPYIEREETDKEYEIRLREEKEWEERKVQSELKMLEELKKKYEK